MDLIDIILKAIPTLAAWLTSTADIVIKATPDFGWVIGGVLACGLLIGSFFLIEGEM